MARKLQVGLLVMVMLAAWPGKASALDDSDKESIRQLSNQAFVPSTAIRGLPKRINSPSELETPLVEQQIVHCRQLR